jgi:hypothetical protein
MDMQSPNIGHFDPVKAIRVYQSLITELPPLNRQLLLYILDLLAVFASKSDFNKMTTPNLAAIFQPGILSHPQHDMAPSEYRLSQDVLIFLIENQDSFLIGMHGTAADEKTVKEVQSGAPSPKIPGSPLTPARSKTLLGRSSSNASAGADSVRMFGNLRRNVSVSSRASKRSAHPQGHVTPTLGSPANSGGIHRSNTVPSKHSPSPHFRREKSSEPPTPSPGSGSSPLPTVIDTSYVAENSIAEERTPIAPTSTMAFPASASAPVSVIASPVPFHPAHSVPLGPEIISASSSEATTPLATHGTETMGLLQREHTQSSTAPLNITSPTSDRRVNLADRSPSGTPSRAILDFLKPSPGGSDSERKDGRKPNKLQKKRIPGSALSSAHSSAHSLQDEPESLNDYFASPTAPAFGSRPEDYVNESGYDRSEYVTAQTSPRFMTPQRTETDATLRPPVSPAHSFHSTDVTDVTDASDVDHQEQFQSSAEKPEKKRRWRFSRQAEDRESTDRARANSNLGSTHGADQSKSTISSTSGGQPRRSFQDSHVMSDPESMLSDSDNKKGPMSWIRSKLNERKEREAERRARSPIKVLKEEHNGSRQSVNAPTSSGKSFELSRQRSPGAQRLVPETSTANVHGASPLATSGHQLPGQVDSNTAPVAVSEGQTQISQATEVARPEFTEDTLSKQTQPFDPTSNAQA